MYVALVDSTDDDCHSWAPSYEVFRATRSTESIALKINSFLPVQWSLQCHQIFMQDVPYYRLLLHNGAIKEMKTSEGERPLDLIDAADLQTIGAMLESESVRDVRMEHDDGDSRPVCEYDDGGDSTSTYVNP